MKLAKFTPKNLFKSKKVKKHSISSSSFDSSVDSTGITTPTTVLQSHEYELLQAFKIIDTNGDGRITRADLATLLNRIGGCESSDPFTPEEVSMMLNEIDTDRDGSINLKQFAIISAAFGPPSCDDELRIAFEFFDTDRDGMITEQELLAVFRSIGDEQCTLEDCRRMVRSVDGNGDGMVCFEDFRKMMELEQR